MRILGGLGLLLGLYGCASAERGLTLATAPVERAEWRYRRSDGVRLLTEHYDIFTTVRDENLLMALPQALETAYGFYRELVPAARTPAERLPVYLFAQRGDWEDFTRRFGGPKAPQLLKVRNGGYMERGVSVIEYISNATTFPILTHEGFHQFLHHCATPNVPAWINEGVAVLCEGMRWGRDGLRELDPWHNPARANALAEALQRRDTFGLQQLLRMNAGHVVGGSSRKIAAYYAQVWTLTLFLREGQAGKYADGFQRLMAALASGDLSDYADAGMLGVEGRRNAGEGLFRNFISDDLEAVEAEYIGFIREKLLNEKPQGAGA
jgi:hypothetical protein